MLASPRWIGFIRLITPTTDDARMPVVLANSSGFVYYVSITGITGTDQPPPISRGDGPYPRRQ